MADPMENGEPAPRVIPGAQQRVEVDEPGMRPLPWPPWSGKGGNRTNTGIVAAFWIASLLFALFLKSLGRHGAAEHGAVVIALQSIAEKASWTLSVLWLLYCGLRYAFPFALICSLFFPEVSSFIPADPIALLVFAAIQFAFPFDSKLRALGSVGLFIFASFCAAASAAMAALVSRESGHLLQWEWIWITRLLQDLIITGPAATLLGASAERLKTRVYGRIPTLQSSLQQQFFGFAVSLIVVISFCITWSMSADAPVRSSIDRLVHDDELRSNLLETYRAAASRKAALVALLLGTVCGGAFLVILVFKRYRDELRNEVRRNTEALRRRHIQLATLQQITESANRSLEPEGVFREVATNIARLTEAAQVTIYVPDPQDAAMMRLVEQVRERPEDFAHETRVQLKASLYGQSFRTGSVISVPSNLPVYIDSEEIRVRFSEAKLEAFLAVPIVGENRVLAVAGIAFDRSYTPDEEEHRLFRLIGRAAGAALERAETLTKAKRYAGDLGGLYRFSQQLAAESEEGHLLAVAAPAARRLLGAQMAAVFAIADDGKIRCVAVDGSGEKPGRAKSISISQNDKGLIAESIRELRTLCAGIPTVEPKPVHIAEGWPERCALVVPLPLVAPDAGAAAALAWIFDGTGPLGMEATGFAEEIARQIAAAMRRSRLIAKTREQATELKLLEQIGRSLSERLTVSDMLNQAVQNVNKIIRAKWATVFVYDATSQTVRTRATTFSNPEAMNISLPMNAQSLVVACMKEGKTIVSPDMMNDSRSNPELNRKFQTASAICVPLGPSGQRIGVLMVNNPVPSVFTADEIRRLEQVAQLASAAIERAKLYEEACQRADELILLNEVGHLLVENPLLESTLQRIADLVRRNFQLAGAGFLLMNESGDSLVSRGISGEHSPKLKQLQVPLSTKDVTTMALRQSQTIVIDNGAEDRRMHRLMRRILPSAVSGAVVPLAGAHGPVGVLGVWKTQRHPFQPRDLQCLAGIARLAAAAVGREELGQALRASEKRLQEVVDGINAMIVSIDTSGKILSFNAAAERISGWKREAVLGLELARVVSPIFAERAKVSNEIQHAFKSHDCSKELVLHWATRENGERKIRWSSSFVYGPDGKPAGMVCFGIDITDQMLLEAQLLQAQKMESVGALAGGMAHDFNNLLGGIIGQCALARAQTNDQFMESALNRIESAAHRGADLTSKLLAFARKSVLQPRAVDMQALIRETTELLSGSLPRTIEISTQISTNLPRVHGDPTQLQQVLLNLCVNARDAMPNGGKLTITAHVAPSPVKPDGRPGTAVMQKGVHIEISDTGTGMSEEVQQHLFEPFFTTKEPGKGTGLGLSVVFGIVRSHAGQISCRTEPGHGTTFSIRLPAARASDGVEKVPVVASTGSQTNLPAIGASPVNAAASLSGTEKILLIDDDGILRETMKQLLGSLGYNVRVATGGAEALKILDEQFVPAIVLLDVVMPGLAGLPLFSEIRKRLSTTPIVLMSGYSADQTVHDLLNAGARQLIQKPFALEVLAGAIRQALNEKPASVGGSH